MKHTLSNGLQILAIPSQSAPVITLQAWIRFGSADESDEIAGIAHVFEHLLFKGTKKRGVGQIARDIESLGGDLNAYTSYDHTVMHLTLPASAWRQGLDVLSDAVLNSQVEADEMKRELEVILEEIKRRNDMPGAKSIDLLRDKLFAGHTYARPVIGYAEVVKGFTRDVIMEQYKKHYNANNLFLVIAGDFQENELLKECESLFAALPKGSKAPARPPMKALTNRVENFETTSTPDAILRLAWRIPNAVHPDAAALDALALILGQGDSSRLVRRLIDRDQLVRSIGSDTWSPQDEGCFTISYVGPKGTTQKNDQILQAIYQELSRPIKNEELEKAKKNLLSSAIYSKETVDGLAQRFGYYEAIAHDYNQDQVYLDRVKALDTSDLMRVRDQYLNWNTVVYAGIYPEGDPKPKWVDVKPAQALKKTLADSKAQVQVEKFKFRGLTVLLKKTSHLPIFSMSMVGWGGMRAEAAKKAGLGTLWSRSVTDGARSRDGQTYTKDQLNHLLDSLSASLSSFHGRNSFGFELDGLSDDFERLFEVFAATWNEPLFQKTDVEQNKKHLLTDIKSSRDNPSQVAREMLNHHLFPGSPLGRPTRGTPETLKTLGAKDLVSYHKHLTSQPQVLCVVGDIDRERLEQALEKHFHGIKFAAKSKYKTRQKTAPLKKPQSLSKVLKKEQTHTFWAFRTCSLHDKDRWALMGLSAVLSGQGGRLFAELRDKMSLCYTVSPMNSEFYDAGYFGFYIATSPDKTAVATEALQKEVQKLLDVGVSEKEWNEARQYYVGNHVIGQQRFSQQGLGMALDELYGNGFQDFFKFEHHLNGVKASDLQRVAKKYLSPKNPSIWSVVGPIKG